MPYIEHPVAVAALLADHGFGDEVLAAALLHDVVEDSETTVDELRERFGEPVAGLVDALSDDESIADYRDRKDEHRARVLAAGADALAIYGADKLTNVGTLRARLRPAGRGGRRGVQGAARPQGSIWRADLAMLRASSARSCPSSTGWRPSSTCSTRTGSRPRGRLPERAARWRQRRRRRSSSSTATCGCATTRRWRRPRRPSGRCRCSCSTSACSARASPRPTGSPSCARRSPISTPRCAGRRPALPAPRRGGRGGAGGGARVRRRRAPRQRRLERLRAAPRAGAGRGLRGGGDRVHRPPGDDDRRRRAR